MFRVEIWHDGLLVRVHKFDSRENASQFVRNYNVITCATRAVHA